MVAPRESAALAPRLIAETCARQGIGPGQLFLHADRSPSMTSKPVALLLADLGVTRSHSRLQVSNDNPFSEAPFKTRTSRQNFPARFGSLEDARVFCQGGFSWYHGEHRHTGLGLMPPQPPMLPHAVWMNPPKEDSASQDRAGATISLENDRRVARRGAGRLGSSEPVIISPHAITTQTDEVVR